MTTCAETTLKRNMITFTLGVNDVHLGRPPPVTTRGGQRRKAKAFLVMSPAALWAARGRCCRPNAAILPSRLPARLSQTGTGEGQAGRDAQGRVARGVQHVAIVFCAHGVPTVPAWRWNVARLRAENSSGLFKKRTETVWPHSPITV